jgi:hypothetical protein
MEDTMSKEENPEDYVIPPYIIIQDDDVDDSAGWALHFCPLDPDCRQFASARRLYIHTPWGSLMIAFTRGIDDTTVAAVENEEPRGVGREVQLLVLVGPRSCGTPDNTQRLARPGLSAADPVYKIRMVYPQRPPQMFLSLRQVEARIGLRPGGLTSAELPPPDAIIGPVKEDGTLPTGSTMRGWLPETIDYWKQTRPGRGFRSDVRKPPARVYPPRVRVYPRRPRSSTTGRFLPRKSEE